MLRDGDHDRCHVGDTYFSAIALLSTGTNDRYWDMRTTLVDAARWYNDSLVRY
jgi:hypothetical protein